MSQPKALETYEVPKMDVRKIELATVSGQYEDGPSNCWGNPEMNCGHRREAAR